MGTLKNGSRERGNNEKANISLAEASEIKFDSQQDTTVEEFNQFWKAFPPSYIPMFIFIAIAFAIGRITNSAYLNSRLRSYLQCAYSPFKLLTGFVIAAFTA